MDKALSVKSKVAYGIGDMSICLTTATLSILYFKFLTDYQGLNPFMVGIVIALARIWDGVSDPIVGYLADRTKTKLGSYRPYLIFGALPLALSFMAMWYVPNLPDLGKLIYYGASYIVFDTCLTVVFIPYVSLTTRITDNYDERTSVTSYRMVFSLSASMLANVVPTMIIGPMKRINEATGAVTYANSSTIWAVVIVIAIASAAVLLITGFGTKELSYKAPGKQSILTFFKVASKNKPYVLATSIYLMIQLCFQMILGVVLYYFENCLGIYSISIFLALIFIFSLISVPTIWKRISDKYDKIKSFKIGAVIIIVVGGILAFMPKGLPMPLLYVMFAICGVGIGAGQTLPWAIIPDTMDYAEYTSGFRNDAMMYSVMTALKKGISAITPIIIGTALTIGGYDPDLAVQPVSAMIAIRFAFGGVPIICVLVAIFLARKYPLTRKDCQRISTALRNKHLNA